MDTDYLRDAIAVDCSVSGDGWLCSVRIGPAVDATHHEVDVSREELQRLDPESDDPTRLVRLSIGYLLQREPRESILRRFAIRTIASYFPTFPEDIRRRL